MHGTMWYLACKIIVGHRNFLQDESWHFHDTSHGISTICDISTGHGISTQRVVAFTCNMHGCSHPCHYPGSNPSHYGYMGM